MTSKDQQAQHVQRAIQFFRDQGATVEDMAQQQFGDILRDIERLQSGSGTDEEAVRDFVKIGAAATENLKDLILGMIPVVQILVALRTHETGATEADTWDKVEELIRFRQEQG